jgi:hypothetical protein
LKVFISSIIHIHLTKNDKFIIKKHKQQQQQLNDEKRGEERTGFIESIRMARKTKKNTK